MRPKFAPAPESPLGCSAHGGIELATQMSVNRPKLKPKNPPGTLWIGLLKEHYGIHGTPDPGHIRHGETAGCTRMTNWDVDDLSHMVPRGTPVVLEE
jgi:lipoprotein-anchoring transpeptidase ErfK/SrfK